MGGPAGMGNAHAAADILVAAVFCQVINFTFRLENIEVSIVVDQCHTGRVIASVFQSPKALYQYRISFLLTDISYYSTHILVSVLFFRLQKYKKIGYPMQDSRIFYQ